MMTDGNIAYCLLGIESESKIHYAMPVKNMVYDSLQLAHQVTETAKSHRDKDRKSQDYKPSSHEYLSGFYKTDRLLPVLTLTIFFGSEPWDGPLTLKEMYSSADETVLQYLPDYRINLIAPERMPESEMEEFRSSLKEVLLYIKYSKNKAKLQEVTQKDTGFRTLERQAAEVINVTTNSRLKYPEGKDVVDVCLAIQEMVEDSEVRGEIRGAVKMCKKFNLSIQDTIRHIAEQFALSEQRAEEEIKKYWK